MNRFSLLLARVMVSGTLVAASVIAGGLLWYLSAHVGAAPGDHIFRGEPKYLENPVQMVRHTFERNSIGERRSLVMIGVFLLLLNPIVRVFLAGVGYFLEGNRLYMVISGIVFVVLLVSFFW